MAKKKRKIIQIRASHELFDLLQEIGELDGTSVSAVGREALEALKPGFEKTLELMRITSKLKEETKKVKVSKIIEKGDQMEANFKEALDEITRTLLDDEGK